MIASISVAAEENSSKDGSPAFGFAAVWLALQGLFLGVWGTWNMKFAANSYKIGVVVGMTAMMATQMFTMAILAGGAWGGVNCMISTCWVCVNGRLHEWYTRRLCCAPTSAFYGCARRAWLHTRVFLHGRGVVVPSTCFLAILSRGGLGFGF